MSLFDDTSNSNLSTISVGDVRSDMKKADDVDRDLNKIYKTSSSVVARKGERPEMEDAHTCIENFSEYLQYSLPNEIRRLSYFAVFDGHGGNKASTFVAKRLHSYLATRFPKGGLLQLEKDIKRVFYDIFKKTDEEFLREACQQRPHWRDGSTASIIVLVNNTVYVANLGDSKIVLARAITEHVNNNAPKGNLDESEATDKNAFRVAAICLTRDHNPMDYEERQRILATGASVKNGRINNILEVSRSFGDYLFKKQGVTCIPDVKKCKLTEHDRFLIIACDGLWKSFPPEELIGFTDRLLTKELSTLTSNMSLTGVDTCSLPTVCPIQRRLDSVCTQLVNEAILRMSGDNVTCILIVLLDAYMHPSESPVDPDSKKPFVTAATTGNWRETPTSEPPPKLSRRH